MRGLLAGALAAATAWTTVMAGDAWRAAPARARAAALGRRLPPTGIDGPDWLLARLADAGVPGHARRWARVWTGVTLASVMVGWIGGGPATAALGLAAAAGAPWLMLGARRGRGPAAVEASLPPVLEATARGLRAGASLPVALAAAASGAAPVVAPDLAVVAADAAEAGLAPALDRWATERPLAGVRLAAAALALAAEIGGGGARALDGVALTLRQRQAAAGEVRALATQARLSAVVLTVAPLAFAALAAAGDPHTASVLLRSPAGQVCLAIGLSLDAVGAAWMARITRAGAA